MELNSLLGHVRGKADWVGLRRVRENTHEHAVRNGKPDGTSLFFDEGLMVEVMVDGHFGYAATQDMTPSGVSRATEKAVTLARSASPHAIARFSLEQRPRSIGHYRSSFEKAVDSMSVGEVSDILRAGCDALKVSDLITTTQGSASFTDTEFHYVSSSGSDVHQTFLMVSTNFMAVAQKNGDTQMRSDGGGRAKCLQVGLEILNRDSIQNRCQKAGEQVLALLEAEQCPSDVRDVILMPDQMTLQIHESIGHPLEMDRILGDERNYAGWSFVKPEDFGSLQYGSKLMNVTFDPGVRGEFASYAFDDAGLEARREFLIKDGKLVRGLGSLESQARMKKPGVANYRSASWNRAPIDRMANINLEAGETAFSDMIKGTQKGIVMHANRSWSIDDYRNKFQFGCEYAQLIEDGCLTKVVKNPNYRGVTVPFWNSLAKVGDHSTFEIWGSPFCGKGEPNQVIRVGHASPACLFKNIEIFGGNA